MAGGDNKTEVQDTVQDAKKIKEKKKKRKDAAVEAITSALKALPQEQQVATLLSKYAELVEENRNLQSSYRSLERNAQQAQKDKDRVETEHSKAVLTRSRLESLCRELQKQNKIIKDENVTRLKEEEERRKEVSNQFNSTLSEISHLMEENTQNNSKLREENQKMASRLQDLVKQHDQREDHVEKMLKQRELETQLAEAKLAKLQVEIKEQNEKMLLERKGLLEEMTLLQERLQEKAVTEISLRTQLNSYTQKFEEFQGTLDKSNQIFNGFKKEIDEMSKTIKLLEKETKMWREKCERANVALCKMFNDRSQLESKIESQNKQNTQLQSLCRALQQQTKELRAQMRSQGIAEATTSTVVPMKEICNKETTPTRERTPTLSAPSREERLPFNGISQSETESSSLESNPASYETPPPYDEVEDSPVETTTKINEHHSSCSLATTKLVESSFTPEAELASAVHEISLKEAIIDSSPNFINTTSELSGSASQHKDSTSPLVDHASELTDSSPQLNDSAPQLNDSAPSVEIKKNSLAEEQSSTDCESNGTVESELDTEAVD